MWERYFNLLTIIVLAIILIFAVIGAKRGFLRTIYRFASIILACVIASLLMPYIVNQVSHTSIQEKIAVKCEKVFEERYEKKRESNVTDENIDNPEDGKDVLSTLGVSVPELLSRNADTLIQGKTIRENVFRMAADKVAGWIVYALCFIVAFLCAFIVIWLIGFLLKIVEKIPIISGANRFFGFLLGIIEGLLIIWMVSILISSFCTAQFNQELMVDINESPILLWIYNHNGILYMLSILGSL